MEALYPLRAYNNRKIILKVILEAFIIEQKYFLVIKRYDCQIDTSIYSYLAFQEPLLK